MKYIVYMTVNTVNNKIYVGVHKTENPDVFDGYYGCGVSLQKHYFMDYPRTYFQKALKHYGFKSFKRVVIKVYDTAEEAYHLESIIVDKDFLKRDDTYNLALGGGSGADYLNPVYQFTLEGKLIAEYDNNTAAAEALGISQSCICNAKLQKGSCAGYYWSNEKSININEFHNHIGHEVNQYDADGNWTTCFSNLTEAAKATNDTEKSIFRAINTQMKRNNYYWSFSYTSKFVPKRISLRGKLLYIYDLSGKYITTLKSPKDIKEFFKTSNYGNIKAAIMNNRAFKGCQISLEHLDNLPAIKMFSNNTAKQVGCYNSNGELIETFHSIKSAVKKYGTKVARIVRGQKDSIKGLTFKIL